MMRNENTTLLTLTRGMIWVIMVGIALVGLLMAGVSVAMPFYWARALAELSKTQPRLDPNGLMAALYAVLAVTIILLGLAWTIMRKLLAIIATVAEGDPFVRANAQRLKAIGWIMVGANILFIPLHMSLKAVGAKVGDPHIHGDFSISGVLAILLVFVLAGVFEAGAAMREDIEGTV